MPSDSNEPGNFTADIPQDAIEAAMRSVAAVRAEGPAASSGEVRVEVEDGDKDPPSDPESERNRQLKAMLEESTSRAAQTQERLKDTHDRMLRVAADFENWKKRAARERDETVKFGSERVLKDVLPVLDNLERAVAAGGESATVLEGVKLVLKQFGDVLGRFGVKSFSAIGEQFDPARHEALMQQPSPAPPNTVVGEMARGYMLHERLLRPAAVVVAMPLPKPTEPVAEAAPAETAAAPDASAENAPAPETAPST